MKCRNLFYVLVGCVFFSTSFISCSDDDDEQLLPAKNVFELSFTDMDAEEGKIKGTLSWRLPDPETNIDEYVIYLSESVDKKENEIGKVSKGTTSYEIARTDYKPYILVVAKNATGESNNLASIAVRDSVPEKVELLKGIFILNSGNWKENNSTLDYFDPNTNELTKKIFSAANGRALGDTGNDMIIYGSKMYIVVNESATIEVTDINAKSLKTLSPKDDEGKPQQPRRLAKYNGKIYVTLYDGYLAAIDTTSLEITGKIKVGPNPEGVSAVNGKLYVANSGGLNAEKDSTLSVIDIASFTEEKKVVVGLNPGDVKVNKAGDLYVHCGGNYVDVKAGVYKFDTATEKSERIYTNDNLKFTLGNDILYVMSSENDEYWQPKNLKFIAYDTNAGKEVSSNFITDNTVIKNPYTISVEPATSNIYIGTSDYISTGDMYVFSAEGKLQINFEVSGLNPMGAYFLSDND